MLLLLVLPTILFWRPHFFFIIDSWTILSQMVGDPFWQYLTTPDGEHWLPTFRLIYYCLIRLVGENHDRFVLINSLLTGINAVLLYLFLRRHVSIEPAALISLFYSACIIHVSTIWHSFNICCILGFGFFLGALLLTDSYLKKPSFGYLLALGLFAWLSLTSYGISLMALSCIPLYGLLLGGADVRGKFWRLSATIGLVYLSVIGGYLAFAGITAASSHNKQILSQVPGFDYLVNWIFGAFLFPTAYLHGGGSRHGKTAIFAVMLLGAALAIILLRGEAREKRLGVWVLMLNALTFLPVALARYKLGIYQAASERYAIFTIMSILILFSLAWQILSRQMLRPKLTWLLLAVTLAFMVKGQINRIPEQRQFYENASAVALSCYQQLQVDNRESPGGRSEEGQLFCPLFNACVTKAQAIKVKRFLQSIKPDHG